MKRDPVFLSLLRKSLVALLLCVVLVTLCYFFVDRPVAFFVHDHDFARLVVLKWLTYPPPLLQEWTPVLLVALAVRRAWGPFRRWQRVLLVTSISLIVAEQFRETVSYGFGRYWPDTWIDNNPSLIRNDAYGFHPFHTGVMYRSFPSGHTARSVAIAAVLWISYPRWRWACVLACAAVEIGLIGMNYHFVGDVIAGGFVGAFVGTYSAYFGRLEEGEGDPPTSL